MDLLWNIHSHRGHDSQGNLEWKCILPKHCRGRGFGHHYDRRFCLTLQSWNWHGPNCENVYFIWQRCISFWGCFRQAPMTSVGSGFNCLGCSGFGGEGFMWSTSGVSSPTNFPATMSSSTGLGRCWGPVSSRYGNTSNRLHFDKRISNDQSLGWIALAIYGSLLD